MRRVLIFVAVVAALAVAGVGGARSFSAVSDKFHSPLVPLVADGMIIACTALRLAALTRGWRIPGALVTTYLFIAGTVWLNIDTATGIADAVAHALAPIAYAVLVEMLAHMLRLQMKLAQPARAKLSALTWFTSPVITTRVWLHLARAGTDDPVAARALVQQVVRMASRLATVCPSRRVWPLDSARAARAAALQTIRDGLLSASDLAGRLPSSGRLTAGELLALVDSAALGVDPVPDAAPVLAEESESKPETEKKTAAPKGSVPKPSQDEVRINEVEMQAARHANRAYQAENGTDKTITREALKAALAPCGTTKATKLLAALKKEREAA